MGELKRMESEKKSILITGGGGYIGRLLSKALVAEKERIGLVVSLDVSDIPPEDKMQGVQYVTADIRSSQLPEIFKRFELDIVVHLASIVTPSKDMNREFLHAVEVLGTENVVNACLETGVGKLIVTSSGAAYGYHPDNPEWLTETDALRGNPEFAYSDHKRLIEENLAQYRRKHPELKQLIFRPGTILGATAENQITALFRKPIILGIRGSATPFVFIWDQDVVNCIKKGLFEDRNGIFNMAGDGVLTMREIAVILGKPYLSLPAWLVKGALLFLSALKLSQYGPEQINFLRYRPVLSNKRLKEVFEYTPMKTTREVFDFYLKETGSEK
jgi:UDP-glucose 4-epimerase